MDTKDRHQIVVGVDGSDPARNALRWAARLARLLDDTVTAVHGIGLIERVDGELVPAHTHHGAARELVERSLTSTGLAHRVELVERPAVDAILDAADNAATDLVVVGTRGRSVAPAQALGSTALQLLRRAHVPVLVVPDRVGGSSVEARRLVVGFDGSEASLAALDWAAGLAARTGASCEVVATVEDAPVFPLGPAGTATGAGEEEAPHRLRAMVHEACGPLRHLGVPHQVTVARGEPAATIVTVARDHQADLIVVGRSGEGSLVNPLIGSVSRRVAHDAGRPVAVIPAPRSIHGDVRTFVPAGAADRPR